MRKPSLYCHFYHYSYNHQVILYDGLSRQVRRTFGRFKDTAYSGTLRSDGRLMVAGGQNGIVQVCVFVCVGLFVFVGAGCEGCWCLCSWVTEDRVTEALSPDVHAPLQAVFPPSTATPPPHTPGRLSLSLPLSVPLTTTNHHQPPSTTLNHAPIGV